MDGGDKGDTGKAGRELKPRQIIRSYPVVLGLCLQGVGWQGIRRVPSGVQGERTLGEWTLGRRGGI